MENIIVGAGLTGSYIASQLAEKGEKVKIIEKRSHIAGNLYDKIDKETGTLYHVYGPHIFHTDEQWVWDFVNKYATFIPFLLKNRIYFKNIKRFVDFPFNYKTINYFYNKENAKKLIDLFEKKYPNQLRVNIPEMLNSDEPLIKEFAEILWENDYKLYTAKQWGIPVDTVDPSVLKRVPFFLYEQEFTFTDKYQGLPKGGYTKFIENMLNHSNIKIELNKNALDDLEIKDNKVFYEGKQVRLFFSGAIDELFNYKFGDLGYRSLSFEFSKQPHNHTEIGDPCVTVFPEEKYPFTRVANYGQLPIQNHLAFDLIGYEYSSKFSKNDNQTDRFYPISTIEDKEIYSKYLEDANKIEGLKMVGRLGQYKYYDMDKALIAAREILEEV